MKQVLPQKIDSHSHNNLVFDNISHSFILLKENDYLVRERVRQNHIWVENSKGAYGSHEEVHK